MTTNETPRLADEGERTAILDDLDTCFLVEAAAGTGKTTCLAGRMVALIAAGRCRVSNMAAVTFTRKAAAELKARFEVSLETARASATGERQERLDEALQNIEACFVGTIHSFCGRLIRERPVEAGVGFDFVELEEEEDTALRREAWRVFLERSRIAEAGGPLDGLRDLDIEPGDLAAAFETFVDYPDVDEWPAPAHGAPPDFAEFCELAREFLEKARRTLDSLPDDESHKRLVNTVRHLLRMARHGELERPAGIARIASIVSKDPPRTSKGYTSAHPEARTAIKAIRDGWSRLSPLAADTWRAWQEHCYGAALPALKGARAVYDEMRRERKAMSFGDLLVVAARMLRDNPLARRHVRRIVTHLLVDEFQDTDPVQAEVMLLLCSADERETDWRRCVPVPGSLFVVGDPKQSIYRFRRADIATYEEVKRIIAGHGGRVARLSTTFRSGRPLADWVNRVFAPAFEESEYQPAYVALEAARGVVGGGLEGPCAITVPAEVSGKIDEVVDWEAARIARFVKGALDTDPSLSASDFMIVAWRRGRLDRYAAALERLGVPARTTGAGGLAQVEELRLLRDALAAAAAPDDALALVAALRGPLFGMSDRTLYAFRRAGGVFSFQAPVPASLAHRDPEGHRTMADSFARLSRYSDWLDRMPVMAAVERIADDLGLWARAASREGGDTRAGGLGRAIEILRARARSGGGPMRLVERLDAMVGGEGRLDLMPASSDDAPAVRVMNLHQAKGLEAGVVFLVADGKRIDIRPGIHVDRLGDRVRGHLVLARETNTIPRNAMGLPPSWEKLEERERRFLEAECVRLEYVAATRASRLLVVTRKSGGLKSPWTLLSRHLDDLPELPDPGETPAVARVPETLDADDVAREVALVAERLERSARPSFEIRAAREEARVTQRAPVAVEETTAGEHGTEWGLAIHALLDLAMRRPEADLERVARGLLEEHGLDASLARVAAETVCGVVRSEIWARASASGRCLTEAPFSVLRQSDGVPVLVRGVIDLVFRESDGWVVVDYKTGAGASPAAVAERWGAQVRLYTEAWESATGERVKQIGLFLVDHGLFVPVDRRAGP